MSLKLETENEVITKVIHLADIHIRKIRVDEYRSVFARTFEKIKKIIDGEPEKVLIVICGDVTDNKLMLTPIIINLLKEFIIGLSELAEIIIILGNHDVAISNKDSMDAITPILMNLETEKKIHLLNKNKVYTYANLLIGITNIYAKKVTPISEKILQDNPDKIRIALYHGTIKGSTSEGGFEFTNSGYFKITDFTKYYEYGFFGDIHAFQYLNNNKTFAYSSSLIEQRVSEANQNHGFLCWDLKNMKSIFVNVKNDYRFAILYVDNNKITVKTKKGTFDYTKDLLPKYPKIRLYYKNTTLTQVNKIEDMLNTNHNVIEFIKMIDSDDKLDLELDYNDDKEGAKIVEIKSYGAIEKLIGSFIKKNYVDWSKDKIQKIYDSLKDIVNNINISAHEKRTIKLHYLEFDNLFSYGKNNRINFDKLKKHKITGILGNNGHGKSTLIDSLLYAIYDKFSRGENNDALNVNENNASSKVALQVDKDEYVIERKIKKTGKRAVPVLHLYKNDKLVTNDRKSETMKDIQDYICKYEDVVDNNIILQHCENFLDMSDVKKRDYLYRILNLDIFNDIVKETNSKKGIITSLKNAKLNNLKQYSEKDIIKTIKKLTKDLDINRDKLVMLKKDKTKKDDIIMNLKVKIGSILDLDKDKDEDKININELIEEKDEKEELIEELNGSIDGLKEKYDKIKNNIEKINIKLGLEKYEDIEEKHEQYGILKKKEIKKLNKSRDKLMKNIMTVPNVEKVDKKIYNKNVDNLANYKEKLELLINDNVKFKNNIKSVDGFDNVKNKYEKNCKIIDDIDGLEKELVLINNDKEKNVKKLERIKKHNYDKNCKYCMSAEMTKDKIHYSDQIEEFVNGIIEINKKLTKLKAKVDLTIESTYNKLILDKENNELYKNKILDNDHSIEIFEKDVELIENKISVMEENMQKYNEMVELKNKNKELEEEIKNIDEEIDTLESEEDAEYNNYLEIKERLNINDEKKMKLDKMIFNKKKLLDVEECKFKKLEKEYNENIENIEKIKSIIELDKLNLEMENISENIKEIEIENKKMNKILVENECDMKIIVGIKKEIDEYLMKYEMYSEISNIIETKNGLVNHIMNDIVLVQVESKVNKLLTVLTDFTIELEYNNKRIIVYKVEGKHKLKASSLCGFERFVCNMVFRVVFNQINCKVKCDFLIIDEGFSCCDQDNLIRLKALFDVIREKYSWCLVITHLEMIKDYFDEMLNIEKVGGKSSITF
jgi:DNA repair exonuclease SbcCD ATPase subunit